MRRLDEFADYLRKERRYSPHTLTAYIYDVEQFFSFIAQRYELDDALQIKPSFIKAWMYELMQQKSVPRSINRKLASLRSYYRFLQRSGDMKKSPLASIRGLKTETRLPNWVSEEDMKKEVDFRTVHSDYQFILAYIIIDMLYGTGMRLSELTGLKANDVLTAEKTIKVLGKRNKERIIPITDALAASLIEYLQVKRNYGIDGSEFFLLTEKGRQLYPMYIYRVVKDYISQVSTIPKNSPHVLRHTYATHLLNNGAGIGAIKELLGHSSLAATQIYTHNSIEQLKSIYKQAHPKG